jgi:hypothetical protein
LTQEYFVYSKENWQSMAEKEPPFGRVDNLQTSPKGRLAKIFKKICPYPLRES